MRPMMRMGRFGCLMHWGLQHDSILNLTIECVLMQQVKLKLALIVTGALAAISLLALPSACGGGSAASGDLNIAGVVQASTSTPASPTAPVKATVLSSGLSSPWGMAFLPDGRMVVTQKAGTMVIVSANGTTESASFSPGLPNLTSTGQGGLLDVVIDPDFNLATNPRIYWAFSETGAGGAGTAVAHRAQRRQRCVQGRGADGQSARPAHPRRQTGARWLDLFVDGCGNVGSGGAVSVVTT